MMRENTPNERIQAMLDGRISPVKFVYDESQQVRFAAVTEIEKKIMKYEPKILFDEGGKPYVMNTPERDALKKLACDLAPTVHMNAIRVLKRIEERDLKAAIRTILKKHGMTELAKGLGMNMEKSIINQLLGEEISEIPAI